MEIVESSKALKSALKKLSTTQLESIGFVPTMGALHDGHISLVKKCKDENEFCIVSIFLNPTQFNNPNDLERYPRTKEQDFKFLESAGCDMVFYPSVEDLYTENELKNTFDFDFEGLDSVMEGKYRPGHFNGVVQVVSKLFKLVQAQKAYFGEKDFQQVAVIRLMTKKMNFSTEIVSCPIIREADGLAMSSRNMLLNEDERKKAQTISKVLVESRKFANDLSVEDLRKFVINSINKIDLLEVEYFEIVNGINLQAITDWSESSYIVGCITVFCGSVRLIDNIQYK